MVDFHEHLCDGGSALNSRIDIHHDPVAPATRDVSERTGRRALGTKTQCTVNYDILEWSHIPEVSG